MPFERVRDVFAPKRTLEVLQTVVESGPVRFSELDAGLNTSSATLAESLGTLVDYGLLSRHEENERWVSYEATAFGRDVVAQTRRLESDLETHEDA